MKYLVKWLCVGALLLPVFAIAKTAPVELGMVVTGSVTLNADGSVNAYTIDHASEVPQGVQSLLAATLPGWKFSAIKAAGATMPAQARMSVRVVGMVTAVTKQKVNGKKVQKNSVNIHVADVQLHCPPPHANLTPALGCNPDATLERESGTDPRYPLDAIKAFVEGVVELRLDVGRNGKVSNVAVRQVKLYEQAPDLALYRDIFGAVTRKAARKWRFRVPTVGRYAARQHWIVAQAVKFDIKDGTAASTRYGHWLVALPGPVRTIAWASPGSTNVMRLPEITVEASLILRPRMPPPR